ncbi:hypothetical protein [Silicimonas sp. MF1-12-2]|uniref:COG3904 family protein n=1 Tax=Silicimonas sp. MF1-12-2 TaxID=3384793 RepID=UPI0039B3861C
MFGRLFVFSTAIAILLACAPSGGLLVSEKAEPIGGNLFVETTDSGDQFLVLDGEITAQTSYAFLSLVEQAEVEGLVIAQSPGGDLLASHQIGRAIKERGINTIVLVNCISACVDIFIAGKIREMTDLAELGLHSATDRDFAYEIDRKYWGELGFAKVNEMAYRVPNDKLWIVSAKRAQELRLATNIIAAEG